MFNPSPIETIAFPAFERAAGAAGVFELRLRLLCDSVDAIAKKATKSNLSVVLETVLKHWGSHLSGEDRKRLDACVKMRNKVFHQELSSTRGHLIELGEELTRAGVWQGNLQTGAVAEVETTSTANGKIYGWLLVATSSGAFDRCVELFTEGREILKRAQHAQLADQLAKAK